MQGKKLHCYLHLQLNIVLKRCASLPARKSDPYLSRVAIQDKREGNTVRGEHTQKKNYVMTIM